MRQILFALIVVVMISVSVFFVRLTGPSSLHADAAGAADRIAWELALERYAALAKNMTLRIHVAEQALLQLQRRHGSKQVQHPLITDFKRTVGDDANEVGDKEGGSGGGGGDADPGDEPEETEEERQKRLDAELSEQHTLIGYDKTTKSFKQRWRPDFKCGDHVPLLPDEQPVECEPAGDYPCCSNLGWCGKSAEHCSCETCSDYQSKVKLRLDGIEVLAKKRECDEIAFSLGEVATPEECAKLAVKKAECGRLLMFSHTYPSWGCRCCMSGTGANDEDRPEWTLYQLKVSIES